MYKIVVPCLLVVGMLASKGCTNTKLIEEERSSIDSESSQVILKGDISAIGHNGVFLVWTPKPRKPPTGDTSESMATASKIENDSSSGPSKATPAIPTAQKTQPADQRVFIEDKINVIAEAEIGQDGTFVLTMGVEEPRPVYYYVVNAFTNEGSRILVRKGQRFILEPGKLSGTMNHRSEFVISGGKYNDAVINSWKQSEPYLAAQIEHEELGASPPGESEEERRRRVDASAAKFSEILQLETAGRGVVALSHPDPLARKLALQTTWLEGKWYREAVYKLAMLMPDDPWVVARKNALDERVGDSQKEPPLGIGSSVLDFSGETVDGDSFELSDVRESADVILLDFWASWCGPCISEFPHMKEAYEKYKDNGFDIVSFTVDSEREDWERASEDAQLPWFDTGMGLESEVSVKYGITGVPLSYLFDAKTGEIVATNLRGHHLDEKLEEILL